MYTKYLLLLFEYQAAFEQDKVRLVPVLTFPGKRKNSCPRLEVRRVRRWSPIPGVSQGGLEVALGALGWGQGGDWAQAGLDGLRELFQAL